MARDPGAVVPLTVEQSNSSVLVDGRLIAKLTRRLVPGENPDVTLPLHLRTRGFVHAPGVAATLELVEADAPPTTVMVVHDAITHDADLWQWSQDVLTREVERIVSDHDTGSEDAAVTAIANLLGQRTAEMHLALAGGTPGFEPEPFTLLWQRSILQSLRASLRETQRALRRAAATLDPADGELARTLVEHGDRVLAMFEPLRTRKLDAARIRVHGDYHLGQVLWTGRDLVVIDFEGEPGQSAGARAIKRSAMADVGGLLRSFDYAGRVAIATSEARGRSNEANRPSLEVWRREWTARTQDEVFAAYLRTLDEAGEGPRLIPRDPVDRALLLDAHVLLKALYEVRYELANRPAWVGWPLAGIVDLLTDRDR